MGGGKNEAPARKQAQCLKSILYQLQAGKGNANQHCNRYPIFVFMKKKLGNILLAAATAKEVAPFLNKMRNQPDWPEKILIDVLISGIGLTASTYHLTRQIQLKKYDLVLQAGVAGGFDKNMKLGSVVVVTKDTIADQSVVELKKLKSLFDLKLVPHNHYPFKNDWLENPDKILIKKTGLKAVKGISVNQISTSLSMIDFYRKTFDPVTESMEGAALHYVCQMEKIPFIQLRSISNYIGERNKKNWNMTESIKNLNNELIQLIDKLSKSGFE